MEESTQSEQPKSGATKLIVPVAVVGIIIIAAVVLFANQSKPNPQIESAQTAPTGTLSEQTQAPTDVMTSPYKDGMFSATGNYVTPGGSRDVDITITLAKGVVTDATFVGHATDPNSKRFQGEFRDNFKQLVVGKNIDDIALTKVSGSSLSPKGFMDALGKIKTEAQG